MDQASIESLMSIFASVMMIQCNERDPKEIEVTKTKNDAVARKSFTDVKKSKVQNEFVSIYNSMKVNEEQSSTVFVSNSAVNAPTKLKGGESSLKRMVMVNADEPLTRKSAEAYVNNLVGEDLLHALIELGLRYLERDDHNNIFAFPVRDFLLMHTLRLFLFMPIATGQ